MSKIREPFLEKVELSSAFTLNSQSQLLETCTALILKMKKLRLRKLKSSQGTTLVIIRAANTYSVMTID